MDPVLLVGAFGQGNPGDQALLQAFRWALDGWPLAVVTHDAGGRDPDDHAVSPTSIPAVIRAVAASETVVLAGGTIFKTLHPSAQRPRLDLLLRAAALTGGARALGRRVAMVGVGVGCLDGAAARRLARIVARQATLLVLRDERSAEALAASGTPGPLRVGSDPAWAVIDGEAWPASPTGREAEDIGLVVNHEADVPEDTVVSALAPFAAAGRRIIVMPWQSGPFGRGEQQAAERIARRLGAHANAVAPPLDLSEAAVALRGCAAVLTQRFHAMHAAAAAGIPIVAVDHEAKMGSLARRLGQDTVSRLAPANVVHAAVARAIGGAPPAEDAVRAEIARAEDGFRLLRLLLDPTRLDDLAGLDGLPLAAARVTPRLVRDPA